MIDKELSSSQIFTIAFLKRSQTLPLQHFHANVDEKYRQNEENEHKKEKIHRVTRSTFLHSELKQTDMEFYRNEISQISICDKKRYHLVCLLIVVYPSGSWEQALTQ